jgi:hypothetical protein
MGTVSETTSTDPTKPILRVVKGDPTPEEVAALVAVLTSRAVAAEHATTTCGYADPVARLRTSVAVGRGAWVASGRVPGTRTKASW